MGSSDPSPSFNLLRFNHTDPTNQSKKTVVVFYLFCPNEAPAREKMLSATVKSSMATFIETNDIQITKQFDVDDEKDASESALLSILYGDAAAASAVAPVSSLAMPKSTPQAPGSARRMIGTKKVLEDD
jgi:hypothetical protein